MRDLTKDLEICEKATKGPWEWTPGNMDFDSETGPCGDHPAFYVHSGEFYENPKTKENTDLLGYAVGSNGDAEFVAEARTGWPEAINRALKAEEENAKLREQIEQLKEALIVIADAPEQTWKPAQVFRSDEQVFIDEAIHDGVKNMADIARIALGLPEWGTLEQIKQGTAKKALSETV